LDDLDTAGKIILKHMLKKIFRGYGLDSAGGDTAAVTTFP
jgi:hypothetical protein